MNLKDIRIMRGPNMWSDRHHKVIAAKFEPDLLIGPNPEGRQRVIKQFLSHYNIEIRQEDFDVGLFRAVLELACLFQGTDLYVCLRYPSEGILFGIIEYKVEQAGLAAIKLANAAVGAIINGEDPISAEEAQSRIRALAMQHSPGPTTSLIIDAARQRNIPVTDGPAGYTYLGYGKNLKKISAALSHHTSCIAVNIAGNKEHTKKFLESAKIPVPRGMITASESDLDLIATRLGFPLVTKPFNGNQGKNVTCNIASSEQLLHGFKLAKDTSRSVIIEKAIPGNDYRLLVIDGKFCAAALRLPAAVTGDGMLSVRELVEKENRDSKRGNGHENILTKIKIDDATNTLLNEQGLSLSSVPAKGQIVVLKSTANLSTGGTAEDVTDFVHPANRLLAEKAARVIGLDICGIDIVSPDISVPMLENGAAVIEVNAAPGLRMHAFPGKGQSREVGMPIVDLMFKDNKGGRVPIVAITGTNGKTTTTRLMAHVASSAGHTVGFSSTDGIYIGREKIQGGDCSGPQSAKTILHDTTVDFAVLECARGGIIRSGLGFDACDIAIVTNVAADHLGLKDIHTIEDLANVKAVVPASVKKGGWAILNAGNELVYGMKDKVKCNIALFCLDENNEHLQTHIRNGGIAIYTDGKMDIYISCRGEKVLVFNAAEVPITRNGKAGFMIENLLPVVLAAYLSGIAPQLTERALKEFIPSAEETPGRINEFLINGVNVIVDYAHNPHGLRALSNYLKNIDAKKIGIITGTGDRREQDIIEFGRIAAETYDEIIIRFDRDLRGRTKESIVELLTKGIQEVNPEQQFRIIPDTQTAIHHAVDTAEKGSYVVVCADNATYTVGLTKNVALQFENRM